MRTAFPPLSNSLIAMVKDTSLAANITVTEMFMVTQRVRKNHPAAVHELSGNRRQRHPDL